MLLVTHDIDEAIYMSDRIMIMTHRPGRIDRMIANALARPRDRSSSEFLRLRADILELLHFAGGAADTNSAREHLTQPNRNSRSAMNNLDELAVGFEPTLQPELFSKKADETEDSSEKQTREKQPPETSAKAPATTYKNMRTVDVTKQKGRGWMIKGVRSPAQLRKKRVRATYLHSQPL